MKWAVFAWCGASWGAAARMPRSPGFWWNSGNLLPKVYWDADPKLYRFAARSLLAGLEKLAEEGRAEASGGRWRAKG